MMWKMIRHGGRWSHITHDNTCAQCTCVCVCVCDVCVFMTHYHWEILWYFESKSPLNLVYVRTYVPMCM